jgi:hypothetical protein
MRLSHSATFVLRSASLPGCICGSFGGRKTCSMTERKVSESRLSVVGADMAIENETVDAESQPEIIDNAVAGNRGFEHVVYSRLGYRSLCPKCRSCRAPLINTDKDVQNRITTVSLASLPSFDLSKCTFRRPSIHSIHNHSNAGLEQEISTDLT